MAEAELLEEGRRLRLPRAGCRSRAARRRLEESGEADAARRAKSLLPAPEQCLAAAHHMLATHQRSRGMEE
jgi:hypothetical protein